MKKHKEEYKFNPDEPIKRFVPRPDPDIKSIKKQYRLDRGCKNTFWNLFKETK